MPVVADTLKGGKVNALVPPALKVFFWGYPRPLMDRTHGGRVFGDMVDTFEYVRHRA